MRFHSNCWPNRFIFRCFGNFSSRKDQHIKECNACPLRNSLEVQTKLTAGQAKEEDINLGQLGASVSQQISVYSVDNHFIISIMSVLVASASVSTLTQENDSFSRLRGWERVRSRATGMTSPSLGTRVRFEVRGHRRTGARAHLAVSSWATRTDPGQ